MNMRKELLKIASLLIVFAALLYFSRCSKNPGEPILPPDPDPCNECPPVEVIIEVPVVCKKVNLAVEFTTVKDQSGPNIVMIEWENHPDELVSIIDTAPAPVDTTFTRIFRGYVFGEKIGLRKVSGSRAEALGWKIVGMECVEE